MRALSAIVPALAPKQQRRTTSASARAPAAASAARGALSSRAHIAALPAKLSQRRFCTASAQRKMNGETTFASAVKQTEELFVEACKPFIADVEGIKFAPTSGGVRVVWQGESISASVCTVSPCSLGASPPFRRQRAFCHIALLRSGWRSARVASCAAVSANSVAPQDRHRDSGAKADSRGLETHSAAPPSHSADTSISYPQPFRPDGAAIALIPPFSLLRHTLKLLRQPIRCCCVRRVQVNNVVQYVTTKDGSRFILRIYNNGFNFRRVLFEHEVLKQARPCCDD